MRYVLSPLDLAMGQFRVLNSELGYRVLCVHDRMYYSSYWGFYRPVQVL